MRKFLQVMLFVLISFSHLMALDLQTARNQVIEWKYVSTKHYGNPFREVQLKATIRHRLTGEIIVIPAFWAGGDEWRFRFSSVAEGSYEFTTHCNDQQNQRLHNQTGTIEVVAYTGQNPVYKHGPLVIHPSGKYLQHQDGSPFFWLADSWWHGMTSRFDFPDSFTLLARDRKEKGFNVIQFAISFPCDIAPFDERGQNSAGDPWDQSFTHMNPSYFDEVDLRIKKLIEMEFVPNIVGLWGYYIKWMGVENVQKHWEYIIARYGAYPVTFTLSGETTLAYYLDLDDQWNYYKDQFRAQWSKVAQFIKGHDPYDRILTTHPGPGINDGKNPIYEMQHLDMIFLQSGHKGFASIANSNAQIKIYQARFPDKPVIHGEVCFEGMFGSSWQDVQRLLFWSNVLQGTPGYSYGVEGIWQFNTRKAAFGPSPSGAVWGNVPWQDAMHYKGSAQIGHSAQYLMELPWQKLRAAPNRINKHADVENIYDPYVAEMGEDLLVFYRFAFGKNKLTVLGLRPNVDYFHQFFDPITGEIHEEKQFKSTAEGTWDLPTPPVIQDWVLHIKAKLD